MYQLSQYFDFIAAYTSTKYHLPTIKFTDLNRYSLLQI